MGKKGKKGKMGKKKGKKGKKRKKKGKMNILELVLTNNPPNEVARFTALMRWGSTHGVTLVTDKRTRGVTMTPCNEFLREALENAGMAVSYTDSVVCLPKNTLCIMYANVWALEVYQSSKYARFMATRRTGPLIVCQTEHQGVRLGASKTYISLLRCADQVWDFGFSHFSETKSLFFPHMLWGTKYMGDTNKIKNNELVAIAGTLNTGRKSLFVKLKAAGLKTALLKKLTPENTINYFKEHVRVAPMLPRQQGNFELHRFGCLIYADVFIVAMKCRDVPIMGWLNQVVTFVGSQDEMVSTIARTPLDIKDRLKKQREWWVTQDHPTLITRLLFKISTTPTIKLFKCFEEEEYRHLSSTFRTKKKEVSDKVTDKHTEPNKPNKPNKPIAVKPIADKPIADKPIADKPIAVKPIADKPIADKPIADKPIADKPITDKPIADKPIADKLIADKLIADKPIADKPIADKLNEPNKPVEPAEPLKTLVILEQKNENEKNIIGKTILLKTTVKKGIVDSIILTEPGKRKKQIKIKSYRY
jgi:hypothetical protein